MCVSFRSGYSYKIAVALSLFLGWLGADRFYLGYPALGIHTHTHTQVFTEHKTLQWGVQVFEFKEQIKLNLLICGNWPNFKWGFFSALVLLVEPPSGHLSTCGSTLRANFNFIYNNNIRIYYNQAEGWVRPSGLTHTAGLWWRPQLSVYSDSSSSWGGAHRKSDLLETGQLFPYLWDCPAWIQIEEDQVLLVTDLHTVELQFWWTEQARVLAPEQGHVRASSNETPADRQRLKGWVCARVFGQRTAAPANTWPDRGWAELSRVRPTVGTNRHLTWGWRYRNINRVLSVTNRGQISLTDWTQRKKKQEERKNTRLWEFMPVHQLWAGDLVLVWSGPGQVLTGSHLFSWLLPICVSGLLKFCTVGFCGIGTLIDFILIAMQVSHRPVWSCSGPGPKDGLLRFKTETKDATWSAD